MAMDECGGNQELDADEQKEEPSLVLPGMLGEVESVSSEQKRERGAEEQEDSHTKCLMPWR